VPTSIEHATREGPPGWPRLTIAAAWLLAAGCGQGDRLPLHPASGRVMIDGQPASGVQVRLHPLDHPNDPNALQPFAATDENGGFRLGTYEKDDGAPAGRYRATLFWPDRPPGPSPPKDRLGGTYNDAMRSGFEVTIAEGPNELKPFEARTPARPARSGPRPRRSVRPDVDGLGETTP
jgi:hypothetical protein